MEVFTGSGYRGNNPRRVFDPAAQKESVIPAKPLKKYYFSRMNLQFPYYINFQTFCLYLFHIPWSLKWLNIQNTWPGNSSITQSLALSQQHAAGTSLWQNFFSLLLLFPQVFTKLLHVPLFCSRSFKHTVHCLPLCSSKLLHTAPHSLSRGLYLFRREICFCVAFFFSLLWNQGEKWASIKY